VRLSKACACRCSVSCGLVLPEVNGTITYETIKLLVTLHRIWRWSCRRYGYPARCPLTFCKQLHPAGRAVANCDDHIKFDVAAYRVPTTNKIVSWDSISVTSCDDTILIPGSYPACWGCDLRLPGYRPRPSRRCDIVSRGFYPHQQKMLLNNSFRIPGCYH